MSSVRIAGVDDVALDIAEATPRKVRQIAVQTLNAAARRGRSRAVQLVRANLNLPAAYVRERLLVRTASKNSLAAQVAAPRRDVLLSRYAAKQRFSGLTKAGKPKRAGASVKVKRAGSVQRLPGAFFVTLKNSGAQALAIRDKSAARYSTGNRRFEVLYGPSMDQSLTLHRADLVQGMQSYAEAEITRRVALLSRPAGGSSAAA